MLETASHQNGNTEPETAQPPKLSKSQLRKQKKVQEEHAKREKRAEVGCLHAVHRRLYMACVAHHLTSSLWLPGAMHRSLHTARMAHHLTSIPGLYMQVYASLQQHALSDAQHALIMPAHMLGQSETKRQQLRRALHHQRAGIAQPDGAQLERERHVQTAELDPLSAAQVTVSHSLLIV